MNKIEIKLLKKAAKKAYRELKQSLPQVEVTLDKTEIHVTMDTCYTTYREELIRIQKKYKTGLWCDARNGNVYYNFHTIGHFM